MIAILYVTGYVIGGLGFLRTGALGERLSSFARSPAGVLSFRSRLIKVKRALLRTTATLAGVCLLAGCGHGGAARQNRQGASAHAGAIPTATAKPSTIHPKLTISGIIAPYQNVMLTNTLSEPADRVNVNEGDRVSKGEVIAVLDTARFASATSNRANLHTASSDVVEGAIKRSSPLSRRSTRRRTYRLDRARSAQSISSEPAAGANGSRARPIARIARLPFGAVVADAADAHQCL